MPERDRPWRRRGAFAYARSRLARAIRPPVTVTPVTLRVGRDVAVPTRDGTVLRANVYLPEGDGPFPVVMCAHPYGKDRPGGFQFRMLQQPQPFSVSSETSWEAPDPARWTADGYAVVNLDLRGAGTSDGTGTLLSDLEGKDIADVIEWVAAQNWSTGSVGLIGVSYLAMSQYRAAAERPPSLKAIVPWEGLTDAYSDLFYPGGVRERGFSRIWARGVSAVSPVLLDAGQHPDRDEWWQRLVPDLGAIQVPMLVCTSFSDDNLHSRGSFRAFELAGSAEKFAYTHRGPKWATFYSAYPVQKAFFDRYLRGLDVPPPPRVRLEVRDVDVHEVREEQEWPLARTVWTRLHLATGGRLTDAPEPESSALHLHTRHHAAAFEYRFARDTELTGPMTLQLSVATPRPINLFVGVEKWRDGEPVFFEGSYGYGRDRVANGWRRVTSDGPVSIELGPSSTLFRAGDVLRLVIAGRPLDPSNPLFGHFPALFEPSPRGSFSVQLPATLTIPVIGGVDVTGHTVMSPIR